jgi:hypothetical protein
MSQYLLCPNTDTSPDLRISDNGSCNEMIWEEGFKIDGNEYDLSKLEFLCETLPSGGMTDYAVSDMGCSVVSERFKQFLDILKINTIEYFPATIIEREGEPAKSGYYAANILGMIDCIDKEASEMRARTNDEGELTIIFSIDKLVLKETPFSQEPIFRAAHFTRLILINELTKQQLEESDLTGVSLVAPERWDGINGEL